MRQEFPVSGYGVRHGGEMIDQFHGGFSICLDVLEERVRHFLMRKTKFLILSRRCTFRI